MLDLHPYSLLVSILVIIFFQQAISLIGKGNIQSFFWEIYSRVAPKIGKKEFVALQEKRNELREVNKEKRSISAQDQYAKWTKLNRKADKLSAEVKELSEIVLKNKASVDKAVNFGLTLATTVPIWFSRIWYRKSVLFYVPKGLFPYYVEWVLALPFIQIGGVGLTVWKFAAGVVVTSIVGVFQFGFEQAPSKPERPEAASVSSEPTPAQSAE